MPGQAKEAKGTKKAKEAKPRKPRKQLLGRGTSSLRPPDQAL